MITKLYRYIDKYPEEEYGISGSEIFCREFEVKKHTDKGFWIKKGYCSKRFVLNTGKKRFAYPTKEEAFDSFIIRKTRHMQYVKYTYDHLKTILALITDYKID